MTKLSPLTVRCKCRQLSISKRRDYIDLYLYRYLSYNAHGPSPSRRDAGLPQLRLAGVSPKMLTQTLRSLARDGLIIRTVTPRYVPFRSPLA